ncbi:ilvA [Symbiodinium natans]|uniref:IlvA protein n=1 Tax=Symbiodinium natans TaxID=878477 RepID=A0A812LAH6_9DINO|nr:ilvA [Symbiodinium natans]
MYKCIYPRNVTECSYRISGDLADVFLGFQASSAEDKQEVIDSLRKSGFGILDISQNELAKVHGRNLIGGRAPSHLTSEEGLFRFEFPEKPGALLNFLENLPPGFNVSLFHYRGHGADAARVLVGLQVPAQRRSEFRAYLAFLVSKGYSWQDTLGFMERAQELAAHGAASAAFRGPRGQVWCCNRGLRPGSC